MPTKKMAKGYEQEIYKIRANSYKCLLNEKVHNITIHLMLLVKDIYNVPESMLISLSVLSHLILPMTPCFLHFKSGEIKDVRE